MEQKPDSLKQPPAANSPLPAPGSPLPAPHLTPSISQLKTAATSAAPSLQAEPKALIQEDLERYWQETARELNLEELLSHAKVRLGEHTGRIEIDAQATWFYDDFKPHKIAVMEQLRKKTGMPMLDAKVNPLFVEQNELVYSPTDKYNAMLKSNPNLAAMRKLFPQIDY